MVRSRLGLAVRPCVSAPLPRPQTRCFSLEAARSPSSKTQVYVSKLRDPIINLSVEHCLMQNTPPDSTILLLYINSPCVVFGRNQNPWTEVNLPRLAQLSNRPKEARWSDAPVQLVRRRSGGGCVFHDVGNVNFSVICPPPGFDRNKHANMVVRALHALGRDETSVSERHDIVYNYTGPEQPGLYKVSGSAYKLTSRRSLHHGTCLLSSPNLKSISGMLRSPAEAFIQSNGVSSVRTPVKNLGIPTTDFREAVMKEFEAMYGDFDIRDTLDERVLDVPEVRKGCEELQTRAWVWGQTPKFTLSTYPYDKDTRERPPLPFDTKLRFQARHGIIEEVHLESSNMARSEPNIEALMGQQIYDIADWTKPLSEAGLQDHEADRVGAWLNESLGTEFSMLPTWQLNPKSYSFGEDERLS
ncbi:hypothetical protein B0I35DRAFT_510619 [Stachybotrys elegans]|uniref:Putative lipoate-protein ligase A n=1 Tax=Stachybotrys elegans TaxID=80388 RepID=A0A8K0WT49_9HYPO|nr:hypothetical protein B0I35DRAFT_510619 [Stachybotrys elegans]